jgi:hypothetical protein
MILASIDDVIEAGIPIDPEVIVRIRVSQKSASGMVPDGTRAPSA